MRRLLILLLVLCAAKAAPPEDALLGAGRGLARQLKNLPVSDARLFAATGHDHAQALLTAVFQQGQSATASLDDWDDLHLALDGLVALNIEQQAWFKASMYATFQHMAYRNNERDYSRALMAARQSLDLVGKSGETATVFLNWMNIGQDLLSLGKVDEALDAFHQARDRNTDLLSRNAANLWRDIVQAELAGHNIAAARDEVARFQARAGSTSSYFRAQSEFAHADLLIATDQYSAVPSVVSAALAGIPDADRQPLSYEAVNQLMSCVLASMDTLSYGEAVDLAARIDREVNSLPFPVSLFTHSAIRMRRRLAGDLGGVLREDEVTLDQARRDGNVALQIETLRSLAADFASANSVANQIAALEQVLTLQRNLLPITGAAAQYASEYSLARTLLELGSAYARNKEPGKAGRCFAEVIRSVDAQPAAQMKSRLAGARAQAVLGTAQVAGLDDDADAARDILEKALKEPARSYDRADVYLRLARLEREQRPDAAIARYEEALTAMRAVRDRNTEIATHLELAKFLVSQGKVNPARDHLKAVSASASSAGFADAAWKSALLAGIMAEAQSNPAGAVTEYKIAVSKVGEVRSGFGRAEQREAFIDNQSVTELYGRLLATLTRLGRHEEAWQYLERSKARAFVETLQGHRFKEIAPPGATAELALLEKQIVNLRAELAPENDSILRGSGREPAILEGELSRLKARFTLARDRAGLNTLSSARAVSLDPPALRRVQTRLPPGTALVEYALLPDAVTVFIVTRSSSQQIVWNIDKDLPAKIFQLRSLLADSRSADRLEPLLKQVSNAIWRPVAARLPREVRTLRIVPAAYLNYLPFQVLLHPDGASLIDRFSISYVPSAATLTLLQEKPGKNNDLFLGALGGVKVEGWPALPGTLRETAGIARIYPRAQRASEGELTHDAAIAALRDHEQVHFATHGVFDEHAPLFSALLVSPAPGQASRLSLYELMDLRLKARLVVLSACETGVGKLLGGDEVAGLTRTILSAGVSTVISSLWKVSDDSTALLMQEFYKRLHARAKPAAAMRAAALEVRKRYSHPFYWAPFVVTGAS